MSDADEGLIELTADIVSAYVGRNSIPISDLPDLIKTHAALQKLGKAPEARPPLPWSGDFGQEVDHARVSDLPR